MKTAIIIPARYASTRFPGKPLVQLRGQDGRQLPLVQWTWEAAKSLQEDYAVYVATDDERIADCVHSFGGDVIMTSERCQNGTERCAEAIVRLSQTPDLIINLQGDAPLTPPAFVSSLISAMERDLGVQVATPVIRCDAETYRHFTEDRKAGRVGGTTAIFNNKGDALYFSKEVIPYGNPAEILTQNSAIPVFHHVGVYGYRPDALRAYCDLAPGRLETLEGLEQLRFLENGIPVKCVEVFPTSRKFWELNNPEDIERVEEAL